MSRAAFLLASYATAYCHERAKLCVTCSLWPFKEHDPLELRNCVSVSHRLVAVKGEIPTVKVKLEASSESLKQSVWYLHFHAEPEGSVPTIHWYLAAKWHSLWNPVFRRAVLANRRTVERARRALPVHGTELSFNSDCHVVFRFKYQLYIVLCLLRNYV